MNRLLRQIFGCICRRSHKIDLVQNSDVLPPLESPNQLFFMNKRFGRSVENDEHKIGVRKRLASLLNADALCLVARLAQASSIDQVHWNTANRDLFGDQITRRSRSGRHDGSLALHKAVEERRLADIGLADDRKRKPAADNPAARK